MCGIKVPHSYRDASMVIHDSRCGYFRDSFTKVIYSGKLQPLVGSFHPPGIGLGYQWLWGQAPIRQWTVSGKDPFLT